MVEGGMRCVKYLLFLFNLIFVIAGIALISVGAYVKIKLDNYYNFFQSAYVGPGILLIVVGVIIFLLAFFGCCGALRENYCLTMTFAVCLAIVFILEIAAGIAGFVLRDKIDNEIQNRLNTTFTDPTMRDSWDDLQQELSCCGVNNSTDWLTHKGSNFSVPDSCCENNHCVNHNYFQEGCTTVLEQWIKGKIVIIGGVGIGLAFVQIVGIVFACCLARAIKKEYEVV